MSRIKISSELVDSILEMAFLKIYPVGSIYMTLDSANPGSKFGGTWEKINGRFLLGTGSPVENSDGTFGWIVDSGYNAGVGSTGGQTYHVLTMDEAPYHNHSGTTYGGGNHTHALRYSGANGNPVVVTNQAGSISMLDLTSWNWINGAYDNLHATYSGDHSHGFSTSYAGGSLRHNNMPPYFAVNMWRRIS